MERTLILIKPDGVKRRLSGEIISRFEKKGLKIVALKMLVLSKERAEKHYDVHKGKPFFKDLVSYITSGPIVAAVLEGPGAISITRLMSGTTDGSKAQPGTIRGDYSTGIEKNIIHALRDSGSVSWAMVNNINVSPRHHIHFPFICQDQENLCCVAAICPCGHISLEPDDLGPGTPEDILLPLYLNYLV